MPPGYRFVCSESSLGYMIPYEDRQCKKLDLKAAKSPPDAPDAVDPFHVGGPEYQAQPGDEVSKTEGGGEDVDATDTETDASTDTDADTGIEADTVVEETPEADESADGRKLQSISRKLLEPTTRCFPVKQRRPADTLHYVIESCYLGPEKSVICTYN